MDIIATQVTPSQKVLTSPVVNGLTKYRSVQGLTLHRFPRLFARNGLFAEDQQPTHHFCNAFVGLHAQTFCHPAQSAHDGLYTTHCDGVAQLFKKGVTNICGTYHTCLPTHLRSQACHHPQRPITSPGEIGVFVYSAGFKAVLDKLGRRGGRLSFRRSIFARSTCGLSS